MKSYDLESLQEGEKRMWERMQPALKELAANLRTAHEAADRLAEWYADTVTMRGLGDALTRAEDNVLFHSYQEAFK